MIVPITTEQRVVTIFEHAPGDGPSVVQSDRLTKSLADGWRVVQSSTSATDHHHAFLFVLERPKVNTPVRKETEPVNGSGRIQRFHDGDRVGIINPARTCFGVRGKIAKVLNLPPVDFKHSSPSGNHAGYEVEDFYGAIFTVYDWELIRR